jgi:hypothetical protein
MNTKFYRSLATGVVTSLLLAALTVAPVAAQSTSDSSQGSDQSQAQGQTQDSCATLTQSLGQGQTNTANQNSNVQAALGTGTGTAATPVTDCWVSLAPGQKQWYKFHVGARSNKGDENNDKNNANGVDDSDAAIVQLAMDTPGCVTFEIWTLARLNAPPRVGSDASSEAKRKDKEVARGPVGTGSPEFAIVDNSGSSSNNDCKNDNTSSACDDKNVNPARLIWRGGSTVSENFYLVVRNVRTDFACTYRLAVAGPTVTFPGAINGTNTSSSQ